MAGYLKHFFSQFKILLFACGVILLLTIIAGWPLLKPGFFESHDGEWMVIRLSAFHQSFVDGHFPVRWVERLNHGYGYPVMNFLYPLPFYLAEALHLIGFSFVNSIKAVFLLSIFFSGLFMYMFSNRIFGHWPALASAVFYIFVPYRFVDLYARGSIGESAAFVFIPLIFLSIWELSQKFSLSQIIVGALAIFGLITSHNVIAILAIIPATIFALFQIFNKTNKKPLAISFILTISLGLALSCFFWLSALYDLRYVIAPRTQISSIFDHLASFYQLILPNWGWGPANPKDPSSISFQIGIAHLALFLISIALTVKFWRKRQFLSSILPTQISIVILMFLMTNPSSFLWRTFPVAGFVQFPWRMLAPIAFLTSFLAGSVIWQIAKSRTHLVAFFLILIAIVLSLPYIKVQNRNFAPDSFYSTNEDTTTVRDEFMPVWVKEPPTQRAESKIEFKQPANLLESSIKTGDYFFVIHKLQKVTAVVNTVYFPGWKLTIDDVPAPVNIEEGKGLIRFDLPKDEDSRHRVRLTFQETPVRKFANYISLLSFALILVWLIYTFSSRVKSKRILFTIGTFSLMIMTINISWYIFKNRQDFTGRFDPKVWEAKYQESQWVNPDPKTQVGIGDWGIYTWAGWQYVHGLNPILINPEHPPLGKYLIGLGLLVFRNTAIVGLISSLFALIGVFLLSRHVLNSRFLAIASTSLLTFEAIFMTNLNVTSLDPIQLGFLTFAFYFFIKGLRKSYFFFLSSLMLGGVIATKFYVIGIMTAISLIMFLLASRNLKKIPIYLASLILTWTIHLASYFSLFIHGGTIKEYLATQKWALQFYRMSVQDVAPFSFWGLVFANKWQVWWNQNLIASESWRIFWPLGIIAYFVMLYHYGAKFFAKGLGKIKFITGNLSQIDGVILSWLSIYFIFLSVFSGFPNYLLLALPFTNIFLVKIVIGLINQIHK